MHLQNCLFVHKSCCMNYVANCLYQRWGAPDNNVSWGRRTTLYEPGKTIAGEGRAEITSSVQATSKDSFSRGVVDWDFRGEMREMWARCGWNLAVTQ